MYSIEDQDRINNISYASKEIIKTRNPDEPTPPRAGHFSHNNKAQLKSHRSLPLDHHGRNRVYSSVCFASFFSSSHMSNSGSRYENNAETPNRCKEDLSCGMNRSRARIPTTSGFYMHIRNERTVLNADEC